MARYKDYSYEQTRLIPICFDHQIQPGTFEYALNYIVDHELDLSGFQNRYKNDATGAPAYDPAILLKIVLFAYSRGIISSRSIGRACEENIVFMALSADTRPHFTTIANFVSNMQDEIAPLFQQVVLLCYSEGLIDASMFAIDGCKISSNCSKEWSGTMEELAAKRRKIEKSIRFLLGKHKQNDLAKRSDDESKRKQNAIRNLREKSKRIKEFISRSEDKIGARGKAKQSNVTDNESAKMPSSHGVIQGYTGSAAVDSKHQVVVHAEAFGDNQEKALLEPMIEGIRETFSETGISEDIFSKTILVADTGYHTEENMQMVFDEGIDAYIPDTQFRKRDPRFATAPKHRRSASRDKAKYYHKRFHAEDFKLSKQSDTLTCPAGNSLQIKSRNFRNTSGLIGTLYRAKPEDCAGCAYKEKCLGGDKITPRSVALFTRRASDTPQSFTQRMMAKIDTRKGRHMYSKRMGIVEPVFGNICGNMKFSRFSMRGKKKVDIQWKLVTMVHNIGKLFKYGNCLSAEVA